MGEEALAVHTTDTTRRQRARRRRQPPLTSMIDVTFLLLVFFLLTFTFREQEGQIRADLPSRGGHARGTRDVFGSVRVTIHPAGRDGRDAVFEIEGAETALTSAQELYAALRARREVLADTRGILIIRPSHKVRWQHVVEAYNQAVRARYDDVGLAPCS